MERRRLPRLSASSLAVLLDCPRCFWLQVNEDLRRPQGPFPSLPSGVDAVLKAYLDGYRKRGELPPELRATTRGVLYPHQQQLDRWRDAFRGDLRTVNRELGVEVLGGIDDLLVEDGKLTPLDFKTRGYPVKEDTHRHYQHQLDLYAWLLEQLGQEMSGRGVLLFFSPVSLDGQGRMTLRSEPVVLPVSPQRATDLLTRAVAVLRGPLPPRHADCAFCHFVTTRGVHDATE